MTYEMTGQQFRSEAIRKRRRREVSRLVKHTQGADIRRERMTCGSDALEARIRNEDWRRYTVDTGSTGRNPVITRRNAGQRIADRTGIRWNIGVCMIALLASVLAIVLIADIAGIGYQTKQTETLNRKIAAVNESNSDMRTRLAIEASDASICVNAVNLNLVSSRTIEVIRLTVPDDATLILRTADNTLDTAGLTTILGD